MITFPAKACFDEPRPTGERQIFIIDFLEVCDGDSESVRRVAWARNNY
jgi:hypothetical protein